MGDAYALIYTFIIVLPLSPHQILLVPDEMEVSTE